MVRGVSSGAVVRGGATPDSPGKIRQDDEESRIVGGTRRKSSLAHGGNWCSFQRTEWRDTVKPNTQTMNVADWQCPSSPKASSSFPPESFERPWAAENLQITFGAMA
jgi:hypothetical protein